MWNEDDNETDSQLADAEAQGADSLKWEAAKNGDIESALEMQKIERDALLRINHEDPDPTDDWKQ